jgi:hypothetical protein
VSESLRIENVVICYPHLYEKHAPPGTTNEKYGAEFLLHPERNAKDIAALQAAFERVVTDAGKASKLAFLKPPLKDGDTLNAEAEAKGRKARPELAGMKVLRSSEATYQPAVVDRNNQPIPESQRSMVFGGCIVNAFIDLYWSGNLANPGCYSGLKGVQLIDNVNVEKLGGGAPSVDAMFDKVEGAPEPAVPTTSDAPSPNWM